MSRQASKNVAHPRETRAEAKSRITDAASRVIIDDEIAERAEKTERLRNARLAKKAEPD